MTTNAASATVAIATALGVPNPAPVADMDPIEAWAALHGIARVHAKRWSTAADQHPAAVAIAQAMDALAGACEEEQRKISDSHPTAPAEDMDYRLS